MPSELRYRWRLQMQVLTTSSSSRIIKCGIRCSSEPTRRSKNANGNRTMAIYRLTARLQMLSILLRGLVSSVSAPKYPFKPRPGLERIWFRVQNFGPCSARALCLTSEVPTFKAFVWDWCSDA